MKDDEKQILAAAVEVLQNNNAEPELIAQLKTFDDASDGNSMPEGMEAPAAAAIEKEIPMTSEEVKNPTKTSGPTEKKDIIDTDTGKDVTKEKQAEVKEGGDDDREMNVALLQASKWH